LAQTRCDLRPEGTVGSAPSTIRHAKRHELGQSSNGSFTGFASANANDLFDCRHKNFAVANSPSFGRSDNRIDYGVN
jgi:hypothetical protein